MKLIYMSIGHFQRCVWDRTDIRWKNKNNATLKIKKLNFLRNMETCTFVIKVQILQRQKELPAINRI